MEIKNGRYRQRGTFMNTSEIQLSVNDYLDLYLYTKSMNDSLWKMELIEKLQNLHNEKKRHPNVCT